MSEFWEANAKKAIAVFFLLLFNFIFFHFSKYSTHLPDPNFKRNKNAIWIGHKWVGENLQESEYSLLCAKLKNNMISDVFVHVGPLDINGNIKNTIMPKNFSFKLKVVFPISICKHGLVRSKKKAVV